jgi:sulfite reductase (NADPH) hemoprotein beta-component
MLSEVENIKTKSNYLRGTLQQSLDNGVTGALNPDDTNLIKFHGSYQQTDRDLDSERKAQKLEPLYQFMIRIRVPGGVATAAQWLRMDDLSNQYGNGTIKLTTRQAFQLHGIRKRHMKAAVQGFHEVLLDSIAGCGDVNRNVMCSPNPEVSAVHASVQAVAKAISDAFTPRTTAYAEVFLDGKPVDESQPFSKFVPGQGEDEEPIYGKTYLPRKFKIALAVPPQNDTDIFSNDIGLIAIEQDGVLEGFNVAAGGGLGMTFGMPETFPRLADSLGFVRTEDAVKICEAIITIQRDHGNRENRKLSRLKYTVEKLGLDTFKNMIEERSGIRFEPLRPYRFDHSSDAYGWTPTVDGRWHLTLFIEGGRIVDLEGYALKSALRAVASVHDGDFRLTGNQNLVIGNISEQRRASIEAILNQFGVLGPTFRLTGLRQNSIACVAMNTCSQAFAEAERYLPSLIDKLDQIIHEHHLEKSAINIRMTGCPNGCGRPYMAEIGLVGKSPGYYNLYLGGAHNGERLNKLYREMLDEAAILTERKRNETFGDFVIRIGVVNATTHGTNFHSDLKLS